MAGIRPALVHGLAKALKIVFEEHMEESLIVISSNVSRDADHERALFKADEFRSHLENKDSEAFLKSFTTGRINACGAALVAALLESGLLEGRRFSALCPLAKSIGEDGAAVYYGAYGA